ncbi:MAG: hypothetical protein AB7F19_07155 [Candidatus Babeliales bacterium]
MSKPQNQERLHEILQHMCHLPRKIISLHEHHLNNVPEFVLYELSHKKGFNLQKAAYFVDNPDFNCMKGVAGFCSTECSGLEEKDVWQNPEGFSKYMQQSPFNNRVRSVSHESARCKGHSEQELVEDIASRLNLKHPHAFSWNLKHGNHGLLVVEKVDEQDPWDTQYLHDCAHILSFCPIN